MSQQQKLACHFFHSGKCNKKDCKFLHEPSPSLGYCPNSFKCPIRHEDYDCPMKGECTIPQCAYYHKDSHLHHKSYKKDQKNQKSKDNDQMVIENPVNDEASCKELLRHVQELNKDLTSLAPLDSKITELMDLDIMFIMDCTGSMSAWIEASKKELKNIITCIQEQYQGIKVRISFVAYRDFCDKDLHYGIKEFSSDIESVKDFITKQCAYGGGDECEDVAGGLSYALQQSWQAKAKYAIFIADSPAHGKAYYSHHASDDYPKGDPEGRKIEDLIEQFAKNDINLYAIKITSTTDKMYNVMSEVYQKTCGKKLQIADLGQSTKCFGFFVTCTINATITQTALKNDIIMMKDMMLNLKKNKQLTLVSDGKMEVEEIKQPEENIQLIQPKVLDLEYDNSECNWNKTKYSKLKAICHTWFIVKDKNIGINWRKPLIQKSQITTNVWINTKPFSAGAMRYAFFMKDLDLDQKLVAKIPKVLDHTYVPEIMMRVIESLFICSHVVNEFNDRIVSILPDPDMLISFVHCFIYEIMEEKFPYKYWWVENFIEGEYEKFNNNAGWETSSFKQTSLIAQSLSHYSWQLTNGYLMIVDLQGGTGILTDPQIHCLDSKRFGKGNLGYEGIIKFFFSHKCNFYCKRLGLINPKEANELPANFNFYKNINEKPYKDETINKLCDLCRLPYLIGSIEYYNSRMQFPEIYCPSCQKRKKDTMQPGTCIDCSSSFRSSEYWFKMKRTDFPVRCSKCRLENRNKMRKDLENTPSSNN